VKVTDSVGMKATSNTACVKANGQLSVAISPTSVALNVGQSQTFTSTVCGGTSSYSYQWYLNGTKVSGATNAKWTFSPSSAGSYTVCVKVTDVVGVTATSNTATVTVKAALSVTISPTSVKMDVGQSVTFTSSISGGTSPYYYQWYLNGVAQSGATGASWTFTPSSTGSYTVYVKVTDGACMQATSNTATVTVNAALSVTISPTSVKMDVGQSQTFTSSVSGGTSSYSYQWYLNGTKETGATGASWTFSPSSAGSYTVYVVATDSATSPTSAKSNTAHITVAPQLAVTISPLTSTIYLSQSQTFTSSVSGGTLSYTYQWYQNATKVSGATFWNWTFTPPSTGVYLIYVNVTDGVGQVARSPVNAQLTVKPKPSMLVTISPSAAKIDSGQSVSFTSSITGGLSPFTYQWYVNGSAVPGASSTTFTPASTGSYQVWLNVTDSLNTKAKSNIALVTVNPPPSVSIRPSSVKMDVSQSQTFTSSVSPGTPPYSYQWYLNGVANGTGSTWTFTPSSSGSYSVYVNVTDSAGVRAKSNVATITVNAALSVTVSPASVKMDVGQSQTFNSTVSPGTSPFSYQWYLDCVKVSGATGASWTYTPSSLSVGSNTVYVNVTDSVGFVALSSSVQVMVDAALSVTVSPPSVKMDVGQSQTFTSSVSPGTPPYSYQWYLNGVANGTGSTWTFTPSSSGSYSVYVNVTDSAGVRAKSNVATITVNAALSVTVSPTNATLDVGQSQTFTSSVSPGTPPYSYQWYLNGVANGTGSTWTFTPSSSGSYSVYVNVTDSAGVRAKSNVATITVNAALSVTVSPASVKMDVGQSQTFNSTVSPGTSPFSYQWYLDCVKVSGATGASWTYTPSSLSVGSNTVYVNVTDSVGFVALSSSVQVMVDAAPVVTVVPTNATLDVGQSQTFNSSVSGGTSPFSYQWYLNGVANGTGSTWTFTAGSPGSCSVYVNVTDSVGVRVKSNVVSITVNKAPTVSILPASATLDVGQSQVFTSSASGGTGSLKYQWYLGGSAVSGATNASWTFTPPLTGSYTVYVEVADAVNAVATSNRAAVNVNGALHVTVSPTPVIMDVGMSQVFTSTVSGGTSSYSYQWYRNGTLVLAITSSSTSTAWAFTPSTSGLYNVSVVVTDNASVPVVAQSNPAYVMVYPQLVVSVGPGSPTIYLSQNQTFTSLVSGGAVPYKYQWYENDTLVSGATLWNWTFTPPSTGVYLIYVNVTDDVGKVALSPNAQLTVKPKPSMLVTISPSAAKIDSGQSVSFTSSITGGLSPFTYQWYVNGSAVPGASSTTFTPASTGSYQVWLNVTDSLSTQAESNVAFVTVSSRPSVSISPLSVVMDAGRPQVFTSNVMNGTSPYSYQWYLDGSPVLGANKSSWTYTPPSAGNHTVYLTIRDAASIIATSNTVSVRVNAAPFVIIVPTSITMDVGQSQPFSSTVSGGTSPYSYQWYLDGSPVSGANSSSLTYTPSSAGNYTLQLEVTDAVNVTTTSNPVLVTVNGRLSVTILPVSVTLDVGQSKLFTPTVSGGTSPFSYQWYLNGVANGTGSTWTFTPSSSGSYSVYVNVTDSVGFRAKSNVAAIKVNKAPSVTISPASATLDVGQSQTFTATVSGGTPPFKYQWYLGGSAVSGATNSSWTFTATSPGSDTVYVIVTDSASVEPSVQSSSAQVIVDPALTVAITPTSATMSVGMTITFKSSVSGGALPYTHYQWYLNGAASPGATYSTWNFSEPVGSYTVYLNVTDSVSVTAKSNMAPVTVIAVFAVVIAPSSASITLGGSVSFTSSVSGGTAPYYYQWYLNGLAVLGAENSTWTFIPVSTGTYNVYLNVTDSPATTVKSNVATVTVTLMPAPHGVGGVSASVNAFSFLAQWLSIISLLAAAMLLEGIIVKKKRR
jgi:hypothetical protein